MTFPRKSQLQILISKLLNKVEMDTCTHRISHLLCPTLNEITKHHSETFDERGRYLNNVTNTGIPYYEEYLHYNKKRPSYQHTVTFIFVANFVPQSYYFMALRSSFDPFG